MNCFKLLVSTIVLILFTQAAHAQCSCIIELIPTGDCCAALEITPDPNCPPGTIIDQIDIDSGIDPAFSGTITAANSSRPGVSAQFNGATLARFDLTFNLADPTLVGFPQRIGELCFKDAVSASQVIRSGITLHGGGAMDICGGMVEMPVVCTSPQDWAKLYGDSLVDIPTAMVAAQDGLYVVGKRQIFGQERATIAKYNITTGALIQEYFMDVESEFLDVAYHEVSNSILAVGRTLPFAGGGINYDNESMIARFDMNLTLIDSRVLNHAGRESFNRILVHPNPYNPFPGLPINDIYVIGPKNLDGTAANTVEVTMMYNFNINFVSNFAKEYAELSGTEIEGYKGLVAMKHGDIMMLGNGSIANEGVIMSVNGQSGDTHRNTYLDDSIDLYDGVASDGDLVTLVGTNFANDQAIILVIDSMHNFKSSIRFNDLSTFYQIDKDRFGNFYTTAQAKTPQHESVLTKYTHLSGGTGLQAIWNKSLLSGETDFRNAVVTLDNTNDQLYYADARKDNPSALGDWDMLITSSDLNWDIDCVTPAPQTVGPYAPPTSPFQYWDSGLLIISPSQLVAESLPGQCVEVCAPILSDTCDFSIVDSCFTVTLQGSFSGAQPATYDWDISCNSSIDGSGSSFSYTFPSNPSATTYCIEMRVTGADGASCIVQKQVTVGDLVPPVIVNCPGNITLTADANCEAMHVIPVTAIDDCSLPTLTCVVSGATIGNQNTTQFNIGTSIVTCTATDGSGNTSTCTYAVDVLDMTAPQINCPSDTTVMGSICDGGIAVNFPIPTATDNCGQASITCDYVPGDFFPCGTTLVTCTATDNYGNQDICTFSVTVDCICPEIELVSLVCDTVNGGYDLCFNVINNDPTSALTSIDLIASNVSISPNPVPVNIAPLTGSITYCVDITPAAGLVTPAGLQIVADFYAGALSCCSDTLNVVLPNCCDPCDNPWYNLVNNPQMNDSCCFALDLIVDCPNSLTKLQVNSLRPGVLIGAAGLSGSAAPQWAIGSRSPQGVNYNPLGGGAAATGNYAGLIEFCLDDTVGTYTGPNPVLVEYYSLGRLGQDTLICSDTLLVSCGMDTKCLEILSDSIYCDAQGNYFVDFTVKNVSNPAFNATQLNISPSIPNLIPLFPNPGVFTQSIPHNGSFSGTVQLFGPAAAGQTYCMDFALHNYNGAANCCWEDSTLCVIIPPCGDCCSDSTAFCNAVQSPFTTISSKCDTGYVNLSFGDNCVYTDVDWGDGSAITSFQGPFNATHHYTSAGTYVTCATFKESSDGGLTFCWDKTICDTLVVQPCPPSFPCEDYFPSTVAFEGQAAVTCFSDRPVQSDGYVMGLIDTRNHQTPALGQNWGAPYNTVVGPPYIGPAPAVSHGPTNNWKRSELGEVFGLAVDPSGIIFTASTSLFPLENYPNYGGGNAPGIFRVDPVLNTITDLNQLAALPGSSEPSSCAQRTAFGNLAYNFYHDVLYVSDLDDGLIYAINATTGARIHDFNHNGGVHAGGGFAPLGHRILGIGYNHVENRIYYGVWNEDKINPSATLANQVWSIGIDPASGRFISSSPNYEFDMPTVGAGVYSNPVSDISFDASGSRMLVSERTIDYTRWPAYTGRSISDPLNGTGAPGGPCPTRMTTGAHAARTIEYISSSTTSTFTGSYVSTAVGKYTGSHTAGGNDYLYADSLLMECDSFVVVMEDNFWRQSSSSSIPQLGYGVRGMPRTGASIAQSWLFDLDMNIATWGKRGLGDIEVFRDLCCEDSSMVSNTLTCDSLNYAWFDVMQDTSNCIPGQYPDLIVSPIYGAVIPDWIDYDWQDDGVIDQTTTPAHMPVTWGAITNANLIYRVTAYKILDSDTCSYEVLRDVELDLCPSDPNSIDEWTPSAEVSVFPNPTEGLVTIRSEQSEQLRSIILFDLSGRAVLQESISSLEHTLELHSLARGTYTLRVIDEAGRAAHIRLVKE